jgi:hypothetical protein
MKDTLVKQKIESLKYSLTLHVHKSKQLKCSRRQDRPNPTNIENKEFEQVKSFKYLESAVNTDDRIEEEIK